MILRSMRIAGWRCFVDPVEIGPFGENMNILYAPNGSGKSTLFEALLRCLFDGHLVTGRDIEAVRPWGRALVPTVTVEFTHEDTDLRITKQFLEGASSKIERKENGRFVGLAEGRQADERVREILSCTPPGRGLARYENWGLAQVLWAPQGELALKQLSGDLVADIRSSLGVQISGVGTGPVEEQIEKLYLQFFTPGGRLKAGKDAPRIVDLEERLREAKERNQILLEQQQAFEEATRRVEELRAKRAQVWRDEEVMETDLEEARGQADSYKALHSRQEQQEERVKSAEAQYNGLKQRCEAIQRTRQELKEVGDETHQLEEEVPLQAREADDREKEAARTKAALEDARKDQQAVDDAQQKAELARQYTESWKTGEGLEKRLERVRETQETLDQQRKERSELIAPVTKDLKAIRKAIKDRDDAQVQIEAALITLEIVPEQDGALTVVSGEPAEDQTLCAEHPLRIKGSPEVIVDLPGIGRMRAMGPVGSIEEHREKRDRAERRLKKHTEGFGTDDLEELEGLRDKVRDLDKQIAGTEAQLETLLSEESVEDIEHERSRIKAVVEQMLNSYPEWESTFPESEELIVLAEEARRSFKREVEKAEAEWTAAQSASTAAAEQKATLIAQLEGTDKRVRSLEFGLAELSNDGKTDEEREKELGRLAMAWDAARANLEEVEKQIADFGEDPLPVVTVLERQLEATEQEAARARDEEKSEEGRIAHMSAQGPYTELALAEEEVGRLEQEVKHEELRVAGIRLLYDTIVQCREEAMATITGPVEAAATRILRRVAGTRLGGIQFGESFEPSHVSPELAGTSVSLDCVSGGEKEQIYLATRLALAEVLAKEKRQLVVFDDVLTATDTGRLARIMTVLEEIAQRLQVLILTCHPERYRGLERASFLDLEAILRDGATA